MTYNEAYRRELARLSRPTTPPAPPAPLATETCWHGAPPALCPRCAPVTR